MRKLTLSLAFLFSSFLIQAQIAKIVTRVDEAGDVASFELDCTVKFPTLAKGLKYNITRHEFKGPELKNTYHLMLVMDGFFTSTLNEVMTISIVFSDGSKVSEIETIESDGYFDGACTINMKSPPELSLKHYLKKVVVNTGKKEVVYEVSAQKSKEYRKNIENIVNAK
ncbi:hypothetical protein [Flavobacterium nackdongense]|uniref:Uncharacterized protein n=1 Tax=Flavobacterium nackdongense TaxID=2547394 RepID=A0A4P6YIM8_9FLAO|nr:hypothetical protein [Flavobacterium nackdongense]QBN20343.1 hypothetical protein E1750_16600 [Flavobacterium nackdongense]